MSAFATNEVEAKLAQALLALIGLNIAKLDEVREEWGSSQGLPDNSELDIKWERALVRIRSQLEVVADDGFPDDPTVPLREALEPFALVGKDVDCGPYSCRDIPDDRKLGYFADRSGIEHVLTYGTFRDAWKAYSGEGS